ncbi:MAG: restriction endonuclease [Bacteroidetes bacterium]|nr:restriction endonuclease [Bacteroidota bacterium]
MPTNHILITKASGEKVIFDPKKLIKSLSHSGANGDTINSILAEIISELHEESTTKEIYKKAFKLLAKTSRSFAAKYKLRKAIQELGPTGYPFERYVAEILKYQGYSVNVGVTIKGHCIEHEVDVMALKGNTLLIVECKFHANPNHKSDVKVPLYVHSRYNDMVKALRKDPKNKGIKYQGWIVNSTRFTADAAQYGSCVGLRLIGWDYPAKGSLKEMIDLSHLHPVTSLTTLTKAEKQRLLDKKVILCREICEDELLLSEIGIKSNRIGKIRREAEDLCT